MRALVTGASGFVGQWLCAALVERGDFVTGTAVDVGPDGVPPVREELRQAVRWTRVDLRRREEIAAMLDAAAPDVIFHLAGVTFVPTATADPALAYEVNVVAAARMFAEVAARKAAGTLDPTILVVGSGEQYGRHEGVRPLAEDVEQQPISVYGATKVAQETAALQSWRATGVRRDVIDAYLALAAGGQPGEVYNVASGQGRTVGELATLVLDRVGVAAELEPVAEYIRPVDLPVLVGDPTKLREATDWRPRSGIEHAIDELIDAASR